MKLYSALTRLHRCIQAPLSLACQGVRATLHTSCSTIVLAGLLMMAGQAQASPSPAPSERETAVHPVRGFLPDLNFTLEGAGKKTYTEADFSGKVVLMFFGYASCPDICPTTMAQLSHVMQALGEQASDVRILFVSVDPHRDTPDILQAYVNAFDEQHAIGLTGTEQQIAQLARRYRVAYQIEKPREGSADTYEVAHSRGIYMFDKQGKARLLASDGESVEALTRGVQSILALK